MSINRSGVHINKSENDKRSACEFVFSDRSVECSFDQKSEIIDYQDIKIEFGGNNNNLMFFNQKTDQIKIFYVEHDRQLLKFLSKISVLSKLISAGKKSKRNAHVFELTVLGSIVAFLVLIVVFRGPIFSPLATSIDFETEKKIADKIFKKDVEATPKKVQDALNSVVQPLVAVDPVWKDRYTVHYSYKNELNAYATLGGHMFIQKGLIDALETPEELLGVVAHEMIHVKERHVVKGIVQVLGPMTILQAVLGDVAGLAVLVSQGAPLLMLSYSRDLETEADLKAVEMLVQAGISPKGLGSSLNKIQEHYQKIIKEQPGSEILEKIEKVNWLRSHPEMSLRLKNLEDKIATMDLSKIKPLDQTSWKVLKSTE